MKTLAMVLSAVLMVASPVFTGAQTTTTPTPTATSPGAAAAVQAAGNEFNWVPLAIGAAVVVARYRNS